MSAINSIVVTFANRNLAESAVQDLKQANVDLKNFSIVSKDSLEIEGLTATPDIGALKPAFSDCIPEDVLRDYEAELHAGRPILVAFGTPESIAQAKNVIDATHPEGWDGGTGTSVYYGCPV